jgi:hypothetical protein
MISEVMEQALQQLAHTESDYQPALATIARQRKAETI